MINLFHLKNNKWLALMLALMLGAAVYLGWTSWKIVSTWKTAQAVKSDCAIVLGAAVWDGKPSPAMRERLDVALDLYQKGITERMIVSGGIGQGEVSEAQVMRDYLVQNGVPSAAISLEDRSTSTWENLVFSHKVMSNQGWDSAILVTHGFHTYRSLKMAGDLGLTATAQPVTATPLNIVYYTIRECLALAAYTVRLDKLIS